MHKVIKIETDKRGSYYTFKNDQQNWHNDCEGYVTYGGLVTSPSTTIVTNIPYTAQEDKLLYHQQIDSLLLKLAFA